MLLPEVQDRLQVLHCRGTWGTNIFHFEKFLLCFTASKMTCFILAVQSAYLDKDKRLIVIGPSRRHKHDSALFAGTEIKRRAKSQEENLSNFLMYLALSPRDLHMVSPDKSL